MLKGTCHCGAAGWTFEDMPKSATACNCTICRRYGVLWAYGFAGHGVETSGPTTSYLRADGGDITFHFCATCGCVTHYAATAPGEDGRVLTAVNLRMADPDPIFDLPVEHFDGHIRFARSPDDDRTVRDMWF